MNILPMVFSVLALVSILSYTRMQDFIASKALFLEYQAFQTEHQQETLFVAAKKSYEAAHRSVKDSGPKSPRIAATKKLNLYPLLAKEGFELKRQETHQFFKRLLEVEFGSALFFQEALEKNPLFLEEFFVSLAVAYQKYCEKQGKPLKTVKELVHLVFTQEEHQVFLYHLLKDYPKEEELDEEVLTEETLTSVAPSPLLDLLEIKEKVLPYRLFLMHRPLLMALFQNEEVVQKIMKERLEMYKITKGGKEDKDSLSASFKRNFENAVPSWMRTESLNWQVSGTLPSTLNR